MLTHPTRATHMPDTCVGFILHLSVVPKYLHPNSVMHPLGEVVLVVVGVFAFLRVYYGPAGPAPACTATHTDASATGIVLLRDTNTSWAIDADFSVHRAKDGSYTCKGRSGVSPCVFRAQDGEDRLYADRLKSFPVGPENTILEMGALDGVTFSSTWFFEYHLGWRAVHFEPSAKNFPRLTRNRPGAINIQRALCAHDDERSVAWIEQRDVGGVNGIEALMAPAFKNHYHPAAEFAAGRSAMTNVTCGPLWRYLQMLGIRTVALWILDVEGAELEVLRGFRWNEVAVETIVVEEDGLAPMKDAQVRALVTSHGYTHEKVGRNGWYTKA